uniref:head-tail adaptor protein n=1 Tax=Staphylococcus epidermidis TaxID=1282 RepID=UPI00163BFF79
MSRVGGKPGKEYSEDTLFNCWASIENVWLKDIQQAKANNTETDLTITIRDPLNTFEIKKTHAVKILKW